MITFFRHWRYTTLAVVFLAALFTWMALASKPWYDYLIVIGAVALLAWDTRPRSRERQP